MAHLLPTDLARLELAGGPRAELETLKLLHARLPVEYAVFHAVHWAQERPGKTRFGEIDFVIVNAAGEVLLIEQKNARLEETAAGLVAHYPDGTRSVADQVHRAIGNVLDKFKRAHAGRSLRLDYLIYCPAHRLRRVNAAGLDASRIVDASQRERLPERIRACLGPGAPGLEAWATTVREFFQQHLDLVPDIHAHVSGQALAFTRLGGQLARFLRGIEMHPLRLRVRGAPGCGKSLIAREMFDAALGRGQRPLLVCFNRPLAERLKATVRPGGCVTTFNGLCVDFLRDRGKTIRFERRPTTPDFWKEIGERVTGETVTEAWKFDTLIVDEGQDFEAEWVEILSLFLRERHDILWLEDPDQHVRGESAPVLPGFVGVRALENYRSPASIAAFIARALPFEFEAANGWPGRGVGVTTYRDPATQPALVARIVQRLLAEKFTHDQIVILTTRHLLTPGGRRSAFEKAERVGNYTLRRFTGEYDLFGNQRSTRGQIALESIGRFKGQEAPAVIVVDVDPEPGAADREARLLYAAMTRATVRLELVVRAENPLTRPVLRAA